MTVLFLFFSLGTSTEQTPVKSGELMISYSFSFLFRVETFTVVPAVGVNFLFGVYKPVEL